MRRFVKVGGLDPGNRTAFAASPQHAPHSEAEAERLLSTFFGNERQSEDHCSRLTLARGPLESEEAVAIILPENLCLSREAFQKEGGAATQSDCQLGPLQIQQQLFRRLLVSKGFAVVGETLRRLEEQIVESACRVKSQL